MIRYFYSICFLAIGTGLPLLAKNTGPDKPAPSNSSKAGFKGTPSSAADPAKLAALAKAQNNKKADVILTPDIARGAVSPSLLAKQEAATSLPVRVAPKQVRSPVEAPLVTRNSPALATASRVTPVQTRSGPVITGSDSDRGTSDGRLARLTAYWAGEGDYYTGRCISATGVRLHDGHCAVDPSIIPYGSVVNIAGVGKFLAVDTGSAVISRTAARESGHTSAERNALVIDLFFEDRDAGEKFAAGAAKYAAITWWTPSSTTMQAQAARSLFADENWTKIQGKQL